MSIEKGTRETFPIHMHRVVERNYRRRLIRGNYVDCELLDKRPLDSKYASAKVQCIYNPVLRYISSITQPSRHANFLDWNKRESYYIVSAVFFTDFFFTPLIFFISFLFSFFSISVKFFVIF